MRNGELDPKVFRNAAELVRSRWGRGKNYLGPSQGLVCAAQALHRAKAATLGVVYVNATPETELLADVIGRRLGESALGRIFRFNDVEARDALAVVEVLERCAEKLEAGL